MQIKPMYVQAGQAMTTMTVGNQMAFALGAESELRNDYGIDGLSSVATIAARAIVSQMEPSYRRKGITAR